MPRLLGPVSGGEARKSYIGKRGIRDDDHDGGCDDDEDDDGMVIVRSGRSYL